MVTSSLQLFHQTVTKSSYFILFFFFDRPQIALWSPTQNAFMSSHRRNNYKPISVNLLSLSLSLPLPVRPSPPYNPSIQPSTLIYKLCRNPRKSPIKRPVFPWLTGGVCFWWCWCCDYEKSSSNDGVRCDFGGMYQCPLYYICVRLVILVVDTQCV